LRAARIHAYGPQASIVLENLDAPKPGQAPAAFASRGGFAPGRCDAALAASAQIRTDYFIVRITTAALCEITKLVEAGTVQTRVGVQMPLDEVRLAHQMLDGVLRRPRRKIVLTLD